MSDPLNPLDHRLAQNERAANWRWLMLFVVVLSAASVAAVIYGLYRINEDQTNKITQQTQAIKELQSQTNCLLNVHINEGNTIDLDNCKKAARGEATPAPQPVSPPVTGQQVVPANRPVSQQAPQQAAPKQEATQPKEEILCIPLTGICV